MTSRSLIVARIGADAEADVARLFANSDRTELPDVLGVTRRHLFTYNGLYFHYVEFEGASEQAMAVMRGRPDFEQLSSDLGAYITPYDPETWRSPKDALAREFYSYQPGRAVDLEAGER